VGSPAVFDQGRITGGVIMGWAEYADVCIPSSGPYLNFNIQLWRIGTGNWTSADCYQNAEIRFLRDTTQEKADQFRNSVANFSWMLNNGCTRPQDVQPWGIQTPNGKDVYWVSIVASTNLPSPPYPPNTPYGAHAMVSENLGGPGGITNWTNNNLYNYDQNHCYPAQPTPNQTQWQIPIPEQGMMKTKITISNVTGFASNGDVITGSAIVTFYVNSSGNVSTDPDS